MHILLIHQIFVTPDEGGGTRHYELGKFLTKKGHKFTVIASRIDYLSGKKREKRKEYKDGMEIIYSYAYKSLHKNFIHRGISFIFFAISSFIDAIRVRNIDIVWGTSPPLFQALTAILVSKFKRVPFIFEVRDLWIDFAEGLGIVKNKMIIKILKILENFIYKSASAIIVNSPGYIPFVLQYVNKNKIFLIPNGVITDEFEVMPERNFEFKKKYNLLNNFIAIYIGNIGIANDMETIINSAEILKEYEDIKFVLIGGGIKKNEYEIKIRDENLDNIILIDSQPKKEIPAILSCADVCLATLKNIPLFKTTYPNKVFDYMAAGKPVILAIDGVIKDVIEKAKGGTCVTPGRSEEIANAVLKYYHNPELKKLHGENGKEYVKINFEREIIANKLEEVFKVIKK